METSLYWRDINHLRLRPSAYLGAPRGSLKLSGRVVDELFALVGQHRFDALPEKALGKVAVFGLCYSPLALRWLGSRKFFAHMGTPVPAVDCVSGVQCAADALRRSWVGIPTYGWCRMLTKWFSFTRLETRTKESNIYASIRAFQTRVRNESKGRACLG